MTWLTAPTRIFWLLSNLLLGQIPSLAFFAWVERNCSLPWLPIEWNWPWIGLAHWSVSARAAFDFGLFLAFGLLHSLLAQPSAHARLRGLIPAQAMRSFYLVFTGCSVIALMGLWQSTGIVLWALPLPPQALFLLSALIFWGLLATSLALVSRLDFLDFMGFRQLYEPGEKVARSSGTPELIQSGVYGRIRHPIYFFTLLAFAATPFMTFDRMLVLLASIVYLAFAIPLEEKKLVSTFGAAYLDYRERVPAVLPFSRAPGAVPAAK